MRENWLISKINKKLGSGIAKSRVMLRHYYCEVLYVTVTTDTVGFRHIIREEIVKKWLIRPFEIIPKLWYHITQCCILSRHFISHHITPHHITLGHIIQYRSFHCIPYHTISFLIISRNIVPYHVIPHHITSSNIVSYMSYHIMLGNIDILTAHYK